MQKQIETSNIQIVYPDLDLFTIELNTLCQLRSYFNTKYKHKD